MAEEFLQKLNIQDNVTNTEACKTRFAPAFPWTQKFLPIDRHLGMRIVRDSAISRNQKSQLLIGCLKMLIAIGTPDENTFLDN